MVIEGQVEAGEMRGTTMAGEIKAGETMVGEEERFGEMDGGRWRPRRALAARA